MRYCYSKDIVYNNFSWPEANDKEKKKIEKLAQEILDAREKFSDSTLAELYDPLTMPPELLKAHQKLDREVFKLYGISASNNEANTAIKLLEIYGKKIAS